MSDYIFTKTISLLTSMLVLSQISAKEDLELVAVSSSSFTGPLKFSSLFMLPEWFASIALGKSLRRADLCATTENKLGQLEFPVLSEYRELRITSGVALYTASQLLV